MRAGFRWVMPVSAMMLAGCASVADAPPPFPVMASQYSSPQALQAQAEDSAALLGSWWLLFDAPELNGLVKQALAESTEARMAVARMREARALREAALTQYRPQGGVEARTERRGSRRLDGAKGEGGAADLGTQGNSALGLQVSWELDVFGRGTAHARQAEGEYAAALYSAHAERAALVAEVARTWFEVQRLAAALEDARATVAIQQNLQHLLERKLDRGLAPLSELARVEAGLWAAQADEVALQARWDAGRRALLVLVGLGDASLDELPLAAQPTQPPALPQALPSELLARRPDVLMARAQMNAAAGGLQLSRLALWPSITLTPGIGLNWQNHAGSLRTGYWSLAGNVLLPVLDRPRLLAQARAQGARAEQAVITYEQTVQRAFSETDQALLQMASDLPRLGMLQRAQDRAEAAFHASEKGYRAGVFDLMTVLDAERTYRQARVALTDARGMALNHAVQVFQALGGGWQADADWIPQG
ncbi:TolC family protein [Diaphorobacter ruginosibacter]|uniref:TolC family protein n=1 Tax=Diaphorobacter ruginosibacter TaxID=1715720 RepID=A0A7G9RT85_9BURK|nr:TolC family protein [Diaphorobacter ruginosibacter]QNN58810.1 TolC family protein [Diaphorobacter ruginosibacter]